MYRTSLSAALLFLLASPQALAGVFETLDSRHRSGAIDDEALHFYRLAAMRAPGRLPADLQSLVPDSLSRHELTRFAVEAFQWAGRNPARAGRVRNLLLAPPSLAYNLDSATLPIRVTYDRTADKATASALLSAAETAWAKETGWGFYEPLIEPGSSRYLIFVDDAGGGGAYTAPYDYNGATAWSDCFTYIVYDRNNDISEASWMTAHELNHAMQAAMDCAELPAFWENTATYVMTEVFPAGTPYMVSAMGDFQLTPWRALDYMGAGGLYEYGGSLFALFLAKTFGKGTGPAFLADVWKRSMQNDENNSKDYYRGVAEATAAAGGLATIEAVAAEFAEARYFVGRNSDGAHIPGTQHFYGAEVSTGASHNFSQLPITAASPDQDRWPAPYGMNHVVLNVAGAHNPIRVRFDGADQTRWAARVLAVGGGSTTAQDIQVTAPNWTGAVVVDPSGRQKIVLAVTNLGTATYTPNEQNWPTSSYTYGFEVAPSPPAITGATPKELTRGAVQTSLQIFGSGFATGRDLAVAFDDPNILVVSAPEVTSTGVSVWLDVPAAVQLGPKTVTVTNPDGQKAVGKDLFTVVDAPPVVVPDAGVDAPDAGPDGPPPCTLVPCGEPPTGCGCKTASPSWAMLVAIMLALTWNAAARRRRVT